jgi:hypothetical protein
VLFDGDRLDRQLYRVQAHAGDGAEDSVLAEVDGDSSRIDVVPGRERHGYVLQPFLSARKEDDVDPVAAAWRANSSPMPDEAPVTSAHGPYVCLSSCFMALLT